MHHEIAKIEPSFRAADRSLDDLQLLIQAVELSCTIKYASMTHMSDQETKYYGGY